MIRYRPSAQETLEGLIDRHAPASKKRASWRDRAQTHSQKLKAQRKYVDSGAPDWADVKQVFVDLQHGKCAYCEKYLETSEKTSQKNVGAVEQDVEHFRPKGAVTPWEPSVPLGFRIRSGSPGGYYMLAFDVWNYCVACKTCNTTYKSDRFPIEGRAARKGASDIAGANGTELPLLLYPLGELDDDPELCIKFHGYRPMFRDLATRPKRRALATIRFFDLDVRENLLRQRSEVIVSLYRALGDSAALADEKRQTDGALDVARLLSAESNHTNCARAFREVFIADPATAYQYYLEAQQLLMPVGGI